MTTTTTPIIDIALLLKDQGVLDLGVVDQDLATEKGLKTAALLSIYCDREVTGEELREGETDKKGWWGDLVAEKANDRIGSKLHLLRRATETAEVLDRAKQYTEECLQWLVDDGVAKDVSAQAEFGTRELLSIDVTITRPDGSDVNFTFDYPWKAELAG